jgi:hypothetical protein
LGGSASKIKGYPPHPSPLPQGGEGEREQIEGLSDFEFGSILQVGVTCTNTSVSPLSLRERARVRAAILRLPQNLMHPENLFDSITFQQVRIAGTQTAWSVCAPVFTLLEYCL